MPNFSHPGGQSYEPLRRILSSDRIKEIQSRIQIKHEEKLVEWTEKVIPLSSLEPSSWRPKLLVAIDGDYSASKIETGFPGSEIGYITISTVLILLDKIRDLEQNKFIDPRQFRQTEKATSIDCVFSGCNAVLKGEASAKTSLRRALFEEMQRQNVFEGVESLLGTYEALLKIKRAREGGGRQPKCPHDNCDSDLQDGYGCYTCPTCGGTLYSTDALRLHELMNSAGGNGEMYGQIKETFKKLQLIHLIRSLEKKEKPYSLFRDIVFFLEGSLTVFSTSSWLAKCFRIELGRINEKVKEACGHDLLILGIEKSGNFVNHFSDIDTKKDGAADNFPAQSVFLPSNEYICKNIVLNDNPDFVYLEDTAFGRKFFYKTKAGFRVVPSVATFSNYQSNVETAFSAQYPRLADCLVLLDDLVSSRYGNSVMPLASAHAEAAIPLNLGKSIFDEIARNIRETQ
jgi:NurA domain-containing protein